MAGERVIECLLERLELAPAAHEDATGGRGGCRFVGQGAVEPGILLEDCLLQLLQLAAGFDAELLHEGLASLLIGRERLSLAARAIEREDQAGSRTLAHGLLRDQVLKLGYQLRVAAELEIGGDTVLVGGRAQFLEAEEVALAERLVGEICEGLAAPQLERLSQPRRTGPGIPRRQRRAPFRDQRLEAT